MADLVDRLGAALLDASLAATAISGLVVLAMVQCRQPARRRGWARAGLISTLALLPLAALNPFSRIDLRGPIRSIFSDELDNSRTLGARRFDARAGRGPSADRPAHHRDSGLGNRTGPESDCPDPPSWARWWARGLVVAYLVGLSIGLGLLALGVCGSSLLINRSVSPSDSASSLYGALAYPSGLGRPRFRVSRRAGRPVLLGIVRPAILIPPELDEPEAGQQLRLGLLHELAHAESMDHLFGLVANLAQAFWYFLPPVWWIRDQMKLDQEFLADRRAVDHFGTSGHYASSLVELASSRVAVVEGSAAAVHERADVGVASALFQRVLMLLRCPFAIEGKTPVWWRWWAVSTLGLATVAASCLTIRGFAGWSTPVPTSLVETPRSFSLPQLVIGQGEKDDQAFDLRFRLPEQFSLTLEILAEPADLPALEVLGHHLGPACDHDPDPGVYRLWHRVRIRRSVGIEEIEVDGRPVADSSRMPRLSTWLSIRALPGRTTRIRDLELSW